MGKWLYPNPLPRALALGVLLGVMMEDEIVGAIQKKLFGLQGMRETVVNKSRAAINDIEVTRDRKLETIDRNIFETCRAIEDAKHESTTVEHLMDLSTDILLNPSAGHELYCWVLGLVNDLQRERKIKLNHYRYRCYANLTLPQEVSTALYKTFDFSFEDNALYVELCASDSPSERLSQLLEECLIRATPPLRVDARDHRVNGAPWFNIAMDVDTRFEVVS